MMNGEAEAHRRITSPNCVSYLRRWNPAIKNCCSTWRKRSQEASPNRPANFIQQPQVRRLLTRVSGFPRTAPSSIVQAAAYMKYRNTLYRLQTLANKGCHIALTRGPSIARNLLLGETFMTACSTRQVSPIRWTIAFATLLLAVLAVPSARANEVAIGVSASQYAVLYEGTGGHNLSISNVTVNGSIGVGGTGKVQFSGPGTITGRLDFSAANSGEYRNTNGSNVGPTSANYSVAAVTTALNDVLSLNSSLAGLGTSLVINGTQTINESAGQLDTVNGVTYRVFNVTSYSSGDGKTLTINGDGSGDPVVFNFAFSSNVNLGGDVTLNGLNDDQVLWNFTTSGKNISLNNNASSFPKLAFQGIILAPNDAISLVNANLDGRVFGGDSSDMQIVSGDTIKAPGVIPEPGTIALLGSGILALVSFLRRRK